MSATQYFNLSSPFAMRRGGELTAARLAFETWGRLNADASNAVLILTGMSPSSHAASHPHDSARGWWEDIVGPHKALDSERFFVICVNNLGSCKGSTGPASIDPVSGKPYRMNFPELCIEDVANAAAELVRGLGIERLHALIGPSMGGMSVQAFVAQHPGLSRAIALISSGAQASPFAIALRSLQREIVLRDSKFNNGNYRDPMEVSRGLGLARKLGVISYRSASEWQTRFARDRVSDRALCAFAPEFEVERYLQGHAERWAGSFDPVCYLYLSRAMDWFDLEDHGKPAEIYRASALEKALVIGVSTDILFPWTQQQEQAEQLKAGGIKTHFAALPSWQGHDAFLVDIERFAPLLRDLVENEAS
jgi:homoserine O-acetyltransferase